MNCGWHIADSSKFVTMNPVYGEKEVVLTLINQKTRVVDFKHIILSLGIFKMAKVYLEMVFQVLVWLILL